MLFSPKKITLPQSNQEFEALVEKVVAKYKFTDKHHAAAIIAITIQHTGREESTITLEKLGDAVKRNIAYFVAKHQGEKLSHAAQIKQLEAVLSQDPNNNQAMDALTKAATEGSDLAKELIEKLQSTTPLPDNVASLGS